MATVSLPVYNAEGSEVEKYELDPEAIAPKINKQLLHDAVVMYQARARQGSFATKTRAEVAATTKKMYRQKGTGNARAGSRRAAQRRGGGHVFAKKPRDFGYSMPKKAVRLATRMAILSKIQDKQIVIIDQLSFDEPKTKKMASILAALNIDGQSVHVATSGHEPLIYKSARNIQKVTVSRASDLNALFVLRPRFLLVTKEALDQICERAAGSSNGKAEQESESTPAGEASE